jgi:hypothetical protein
MASSRDMLLVNSRQCISVCSYRGMDVTIVELKTVYSNPAGQGKSRFRQISQQWEPWNHVLWNVMRLVAMENYNGHTSYE